MTLGTAVRAASVAVAVTAFGAVAVGGYLHPAFIVAWLAGAVWAARLPERRFRGRYVLATSLFALPVVGAMVLRGLDPVLGAEYFVAILLLARLIVREDAESAAQIQLLSMLVLAGGAALSPDVTYLVFFVAYVLTAVWALLLNHLRREAGEAALAQPVRELVGPGLAWSTIGLTVVALVGTATIFVFFPRTTFGLGYMRAAVGAEAGLSDRIELAGFGRIKESDRVLLRVTAHEGEDEAQLAAAGFGGDEVPVYWRANVFEDYDGTTWTAGARSLGGDPAWMLGLRRGRTHDALRIEVEQVAELGVPTLAIPDRAVNVRTRGRDARGRRIELRRVGPVEVRPAGEASAPFRYAVYLDRSLTVVDALPPAEADLALPPLDPRIAGLAERLAAEAGDDPGALASRVEGYLQGFDYSLELPADPSLEHFLFERQAGHCEYYATAMAVLLRLRGVPARVATGFYGAAWNEAGGYWAVRQRDAHAWVEVWREDVGWLRYDPTPAGGRGAGDRRQGLLEDLQDLWDAVQQRWSAFVLDYNLRDQIEVARAIGRGFRKVADAFRGGPGGSVRKAGPVLLTLALAVAAFLALRLLRRRRGDGRRAVPPGARRAAAVYRAVVRAARGAGVQKAAGDTPDELVAALRAAANRDGAAVRRAGTGKATTGAGGAPTDTKVPRDAGARAAEGLAEVVGIYQEARFGRRGLSAPEARALKARVRRLGRSLRKAG